MTLGVFVGQSILPVDAVGTTNLDSPDSTDVPVGSLHARTKGTVNGTKVNDSDFSLGLSDGTLSRAISSACNDNAAADDANKGYYNSVVAAVTPGSVVQEGDVTHDAFIAGGQRVNDVQAFFAASLCQHMFFTGCTYTVVEATLDATVDVADNVDPGHEWDLALVLHCRETTLDDADADSMGSFGFMTKADDKQACLTTGCNNGDGSPGGPSLQISNTYCGQRINEGTGALIYGIDIQAASGTSADVIPRIAGGESSLVAIAFIRFLTGESALIFESASPTSTGSRQDTIGGSLVPLVTIDLFSRAAAYDTAEADADAGAFGIGFSSADSQFCVSGQNEFATGGNSNCTGKSDNVACSVPRDDGNEAAGNAYLASLTSMDAGARTLNWTVVRTAAAGKIISLAIFPAPGNKGILIKQRLYV